MKKLKTAEQILRAIAYPKRGTKEEVMTLQDFADLIQSHYTIEDLEQFRDQENGEKGLEASNTEQGKTLEECKDEVARKHNYRSGWKGIGQMTHGVYVDEVAELYRSQSTPSVSSDKWINMEDIQPDDSRDILLGDIESDIVTKGMYLRGEWESDMPDVKFTHWREMPLPPKPTE